MPVALTLGAATSEIGMDIAALANVRFAPNSNVRENARLPTATSYQRSAIHRAPTTISQTPIVATVITVMAASKEIESKTPSSSR